MIGIHQILPTIAYGDAVSNDVIALMYLLRKMGYKSNIYAENIDSKVKNIAYHIKKIPILKEDDILIYHKSTGTDLTYKIKEFKCKRIMIYHNITPSKYFKGYNEGAYELTKYGQQGLRDLVGHIDYCLADSDYNKQELIDIGFKNIDVLPILIPFEDYEKAPNKKVIEKYNDNITNIVFVGRIAPNKKQEDIIKSFYYYKKYINNQSRLFLVGSYNGMEKYYNLLKALVEELQLSDVYFTGHIGFDEILAYYKIADVFLCMSEHEGFCVPLVESMFFQVPIIAYNSSAIPYTLNDCGILFNVKNYKLVAEAIHIIVSNKEVRNKIIEKQNERLEDFSNKKVEKLFETYLRKFIGDHHE